MFRPCFVHGLYSPCLGLGLATVSVTGRIRLGDFRGALLGHAHMRRSKLCSTKICESNRKCNVLIKDDGSDGIWEAQTIDFILDEDDDGDYGTIYVRVLLNATFNFTIMKFLARLYLHVVKYYLAIRIPWRYCPKTAPCYHACLL